MMHPPGSLATIRVWTYASWGKRVAASLIDSAPASSARSSSRSAT